VARTNLLPFTVCFQHQVSPTGSTPSSASSPRQHTPPFRSSRFRGLVGTFFAVASSPLFRHLFFCHCCANFSSAGVSSQLKALAFHLSSSRRPFLRVFRTALPPVEVWTLTPYVTLSSSIPRTMRSTMVSQPSQVCPCFPGTLESDTCTAITSHP